MANGWGKVKKQIKPSAVQHLKDEILQDLKEMYIEVEQAFDSLSEKKARELRQEVRRARATHKSITKRIQQVLGFKTFTAKSPRILKAKKRSINLLTGMFSDLPHNAGPGIEASIWNNIKSKRMGPNYWIEIIAFLISKVGKKRVGDDWSESYFEHANGYEDDGEDVEYITDMSVGDKALKQWEDEYMTDMIEKETGAEGVNVLETISGMLQNKYGIKLGKGTLNIGVRYIKAKTKQLIKDGYSNSDAIKEAWGGMEAQMADADRFAQDMVNDWESVGENPYGSREKNYRNAFRSFVEDVVSMRVKDIKDPDWVEKSWDKKSVDEKRATIQRMSDMGLL